MGGPLPVRGPVRPALEFRLGVILLLATNGHKYFSYYLLVKIGPREDKWKGDDDSGNSSPTILLIIDSLSSEATRFWRKNAQETKKNDRFDRKINTFYLF